MVIRNMRLTQLKLKGFKSIDNVDGITIDFGDITCLLGANGSGKSSIVSFFKLLSYIMSRGMEKYVLEQGIWSLLFYGPKTTNKIEFTLAFKGENTEDTYSTSLAYGLPERLFIGTEQLSYRDKAKANPLQFHIQGDGKIPAILAHPHPTSKVLASLLKRINFYQFHDTTSTARVKNSIYIGDCRYMRHDAGNLAAFLLMLKNSDKYSKYYERIVGHIQQIMPQFEDFELDPLPGKPDYTRLNWRDTSGREYIFGPHQLSDGTLRYMALSALLLQPPDLLPRFIVIDEPELGLHPAAIEGLAAMLRIASKNSQVLLATQSALLVNQFGLENLVITDRNSEKNCSEFRRPDTGKLQEWLNDYSPAELWEKNVLGGKP